MRAPVVLALAAALCAPFTSASAQTPADRTVVLAIHVGPETFPTNPVLDAGIREVLASRPDLPIDYFAEYLEADLFPSGHQAFADYLREKYQGRRIGVVIANTDTGLRFVQDHRDELFPDAPIVYSGLAVPDASARTVGAGLTGVEVGTAYLETLKLALQLHPSTQRVFVVAKGPDPRTLQAVRAEFGELPQGVSVTYLNEATVLRLLSAVKAVPPGSVILYIWHHPQNEPGNVMFADQVARLVAQAAPVPVYGTSDFYFGTGVVGGVVRGTRETGTRLGTMALRILTGTPAHDIPFEKAPVGPVVDWRQVQRWGIVPARVPVGAQVLFREPSAWERYGAYVFAGVTALLLQGALIAVLLVQRSKRREAEQQARHSESALSQSLERVRDLGSRLLNEQERERSRIAAELHDDVSQQLAVLKLHLGRVGRALQGHAGAVLAEAQRVTDDIAVSVHALSHRLHPARLRLLGLVDSIEGLQIELSRPGVTITFAHENVPPELSPDLTLCLFRIVQEALQNALKHSQARTISVDLRGGPEGLALAIFDDGVGFDVETMWGKGLGLISVRERVEAVNGTFEIRSGAGGTWLVVGVPESSLQPVAAVAV